MRIDVFARSILSSKCHFLANEALHVHRSHVFLYLRLIFTYVAQLIETIASTRTTSNLTTLSVLSLCKSSLRGERSLNVERKFDRAHHLRCTFLIRFEIEIKMNIVKVGNLKLVLYSHETHRVFLITYECTCVDRNMESDDLFLFLLFF